jgi:hypothetical protein
MGEDYPLVSKGLFTCICREDYQPTEENYLHVGEDYPLVRTGLSTCEDRIIHM